MSNININSIKSSLLKSLSVIALALLFASAASALPSTAGNNMLATPGVTFQASGNTLTFNAPDRSIINWNNFGSGTDTIALGETLAYNLPSSAASILNIVNGGQNTTINGTIESNAKVYILNPNGIVVGNGARIDTAQLTLSTVDSPFAAQSTFLTEGKLPSEAGNRTASGSITIGSAISTANVTALTKDISIGGYISSGALTINADGNVALANSSSVLYNTGAVLVNNPTGNTVIGSVGSTLAAPNGITVNSVSGSISSVANSKLNSSKVILNTATGDISAFGLLTSDASVSGKNVTANFDSVVSPSVSAVADGNLNISSPAFLTVASIKNTSGASNVTSVNKLTLGGVHINSNAATSFTGASIVDSSNNLFVYGPVSFRATDGDISVTKANHSFGPISANATGNVNIFENGAINLNVIRGININLNTKEFFFQTPTTASITAAKLNLISIGDAAFYTGTVSNGLTVDSKGNVDLSKLSLANNLNNIAPVVTAIGTVTNPSP